MMTAHDRVDASLATENMVAKLSSIFGLVALALAAVGLSGLVAYMTAQRTQEIGVRMALGAGTREVRRLVLGNTIRLVALGAGIGIPAALALARLLSGLLYQVEALRSRCRVAQPRSACLRGTGCGIPSGTASHARRSDQGASGRVASHTISACVFNTFQRGRIRPSEKLAR